MLLRGCVVLSLLLTMSAAHARSLAEALDALLAQGLPLIYSDRLVLDSYIVPTPTIAAGAETSLREQAEALLEVFPLALRRTSNGTYFVVRARKPAIGRQAGERSVVPMAPPIEEIVVTSQRLERADQLSAQVIAGELRSLPLIGRDPLRAVNQLPGQAHSGVSARPYPRGGDSDEVLYRLGGIEVIEPFHLSDYQALFSSVNPALVGTIDVYQSGFPARYGSRLASVLDMHLTPATETLSGEVDVNLLTASAFAQRGAGPWHWMVSSRRSTIDTFLSSVTDSYGEPNFSDHYARLGWARGQHLVSIGWTGADDSLRLADEGTGEDARTDFSSGTAWVEGEHGWGAAELHWQLRHVRLENDRQGNVDQEGDAVGALTSSQLHEVTTAMVEVSWCQRQWEAAAGASWERQRARFSSRLDTVYGSLAPQLGQPLTAARSVFSDEDGYVASAYLSAQRPLSGAWEVELGIRYDVQRNGDLDDQQWSPRLHLSYEPKDAFKAYLDVGRYAQHQNLYELQADDGLQRLNPPQIATQLSSGMTFDLTPTLQLRADGYFRRVSAPRARFENIFNRWVLLPELHVDRLAFQPSRARAYGTDISVRYQPIEAFNAQLNWSWSRTEERIAGTWSPRPWHQRHAARATVIYSVGAWRFSAHAHYHSGWPTTSLASAEASRYRREQLPDYVSIDVHASRTWLFRGGSFEAYASLNNADNRQNVGGYYYEPEDGSFSRGERQLLPGVATIGFVLSW